MVSKRALLIMLFLLLTIFVLPATEVKAELLIFINGQDISSELKPQLIENDILVSARGLANYLQLELKWYQAIKTLQLEKDGHILKMMVGSPYIQFDNKTYRASQALKLIAGHTYLPLKEIVEIFGYFYQKEGSQVYISKPETILHSISWEEEGKQLFLQMDKLPPYRITKTEDPKVLILEMEGVALAEDFRDGLSNKNFYLKVDSVPNQARLKLSIISNYPIPFQRDRGIEEAGNNLIINFLPYITAIEWTQEGLEIEANGEIDRPEISLLQDPRRLVIDIPGLMLNNFDLKLEDNDWIEDVRVSQFKYDPVILRVVVELKEGKYLNLLPEQGSNKLFFAPSQAVRLKDIEYKDRKIYIRTDYEINPELFLLKNPERLVVNLMNTLIDTKVPVSLEVGDQYVQRIRTGRFNEETIRIVADLQEFIGYQLSKSRSESGDYEYIIAFQNKIEELQLLDGEERTDINLVFNGEVDYQVSKFNYPYRLVVDVYGLEENIDPASLPEPVGLVKDIRVSQFSSEPRIVRFVFELKDYYSHILFSAKPAKSINISLTKKPIQENREKLIVIDPGHGGFDPGAIGSTGLQEKDINLDIALKVKKLLQDAGQEVLVTREDDSFISLKERVQIANEAQALLFVSIHINSFNESYSEGTETYYAPGKSKESFLLATALQEELVQNLKRFDRGVKEENLYVIKYTEMPAALVEVAFISNPHEETLLENDYFREKAAQAIVRGIMNYLEIIAQGDEKIDE